MRCNLLPLVTIISGASEIIWLIASPFCADMRTSSLSKHSISPLAILWCKTMHHRHRASEYQRPSKSNGKCTLTRCSWLGSATTTVAQHRENQSMFNGCVWCNKLDTVWRALQTSTRNRLVRLHTCPRQDRYSINLDISSWFSCFFRPSRNRSSLLFALSSLLSASFMFILLCVLTCCHIVIAIICVLFVCWI